MNKNLLKVSQFTNNMVLDQPQRRNPDPPLQDPRLVQANNNTCLNLQLSQEVVL